VLQFLHFFTPIIREIELISLTNRVWGGPSRVQRERVKEILSLYLEISLIQRNIEVSTLIVVLFIEVKRCPCFKESGEREIGSFVSLILSSNPNVMAGLWRWTELGDWEIACLDTCRMLHYIELTDS
jgi:hypothetical protein